MKNFYVGDIVTDIEGSIHYKIIKIYTVNNNPRADLYIIKPDADLDFLNSFVDSSTKYLTLIKRPFTNHIRNLFGTR